MFCKHCGSQIDDDSVFCAIAGEKIREEKERINEAKANGLDYDSKLLKIKTDAMTVCCIVVAIIAFASSGIINLFFRALNSLLDNSCKAAGSQLIRRLHS